MYRATQQTYRKNTSTLMGGSNMKHVNARERNVCLHTPSRKTTLPGRCFDFIIRRHTLVCSDTDVALCAYCGMRIKPTKQYYSKRWLLPYVCISLIIGSLYGLLAIMLGNAQPYHEELWAVAGLALFVITTYLVERIFCAVLLALMQWETVDIDAPVWPPKTREHDSYFFENRRAYCRDHRALSRIALLVGGFLYAFLIGVS